MKEMIILILASKAKTQKQEYTKSGSYKPGLVTGHLGKSSETMQCLCRKPPM